MSQRTRLPRLNLRIWVGLGLLIVVLLTCTNLNRLPAQPSSDHARVVRIVDGDTIVVEYRGGLESVRYVGMDTPERNQPGFRAAAEANHALVGGRTVRLERDVSDRDNFGRLLRFVYLEDGTLVNAALIAQGWAMPVEYRPDTTRAEEFRRLAVAAAKQRQGFWQGDSPHDGALGLALVTRAAMLRTGPATSFAEVAEVRLDTPLTVFARSANSRWLQVRPPDRRGGWITVGSVQLNIPVASLPVEDETPDPPVIATPVVTQRCPQGCEIQPDPTCVVKGNVGTGGERIYHLPGGGSYTRVIIRPDEGDRWFCTVAEAERNGFRAALR